MKYRPEIQGLRALAVLPVIFFHSDFAMFSGGYVGVDVFFVISGYLITTIIAEGLDDGSFGMMRFYERRARRILPALLLVLTAALPFAWAWLMPNDLRDFLKSVLATLFFSSNVLFWDQTGYFDGAAELKPLLHTWSLAVEEQFYVLAPVFFVLLRRYGRRATLPLATGLFLASFCIAEWGIQHAPASAFFLLPGRAWELMTGMAIAIHLRSRSRAEAPGARSAGVFAIAGIALIAVAVLAFDGRTPFPGVNAILPVAGAASIIVFAGPDNLAGRLLSSRVLVSIGSLSYGLYLWHQPIFALYRHRFGSQSFHENVLPLTILCFVLAASGYWLVERPFRRRVSVSRLLASVGVCTASIIVVGLAMNREIIVDRDSIPSYRRALAEVPADVVSYAEGNSGFMPCDGRAEGFAFEYCSFGARQAPETLVIWGDSLSEALLHGMDRVADERGIAGLSFSLGGCPPVLGLRNAAVGACTERTHAEILRRITELPDVRIVLLVGNFQGAMYAGNVTIDGTTTSPGIVHEHVARAVEVIHAKTGAKVYLVEQGPTFPESVSRRYVESVGRADRTFQSIPRAEQTAIGSDQRILASATDGFVGTTDFFCDDTTCPSIDKNGRMVIFDRNHVTREYSVELARYVLDQLPTAPLDR